MQTAGYKVPVRISSAGFSASNSTESGEVTETRVSAEENSSNKETLTNASIRQSEEETSTNTGSKRNQRASRKTEKNTVSRERRGVGARRRTAVERPPTHGKGDATALGQQKHELHEQRETLLPAGEVQRVSASFGPLLTGTQMGGFHLVHQHRPAF